MKPVPFTLVRPTHLDEALVALAEYGDEARPLAGGQSLVPMMNMRLARPTALVDLNRLQELVDVRDDDDELRIGAMVRQSHLVSSEGIRDRLPLVARCAPWIGHWVTRNRGTVGGSLAHADSRAELPVVLVALGGSVVVASSQGQRVVSGDDFFVTHFSTSLAPGEMLVETVWPAASEGWGYAFEELAQRHGDFALGMVACALRIEDSSVRDARLAVGAIGERPMVLEGLARSLVGHVLDDDLIREASVASVADLELHDELHASGAYRKNLVQVLVRRALSGAWEDSR